ncbi:MAG: NCS2 family permease [Firmicutes bacterium]|nr:NCS2 family permease [Bacillota bacterium]
MLGMGFSPEIVFGRMVIGAAIAVALGNFYYAHMARRLAQKEGRTDVTALAYGISTPVQFIYQIVITGAVLGATDNHELAWQIGIAACFLGGIIECLGSVIGRWVRAVLPRAAMLGALAGVAFTFIAGEMFFKTFADGGLVAPTVGAIALTIIVVGLIAKTKMPFRFPAALLAIIVGTVVAYLTKVADVSTISNATEGIGFYMPTPHFAVFEGLKLLFTDYSHLLAVILPISVYNFVETMNNVEAVAAMGDDYDVREAQIVDGAGTMIGALFGGILPTTVYIASAGSKEMNAGRGYSILNGIVFLVAAVFGIVGAVAEIIPLPVIAPILVYVGIVMVSNAFMKSPHRHAPAVALAMIPYFANYLSTRFNAGAPEVVANVSEAIVPLAQGAMFTALLWGAIAVFLIEKDYIKATVASLFLAGFSFIGLIHSARLTYYIEDFSSMQAQFFIGYLLVAGICLAFKFLDTDANIPHDKSIDA